MKRNLFIAMLMAATCACACQESDGNKNDPTTPGTQPAVDACGDSTTNYVEESGIPNVRITRLAKNAACDPAWPDGIVAFDIGGKHYFAMAGEANDTITIVDAQGLPVSNPQITEKEVPSSYPCLKADDFATIKYSPDSITSFAIGGHTYVAVTLRYAGAVIFYDVSDPAKPVFDMIAKTGENDNVGTGTCTGYDGASKVYPEGISSEKIGDDVYVWVANEGDDTVTMLKVSALGSAQASALYSGKTLAVASAVTKQESEKANIESIRPLPGRTKPSAVAVGSKSKTLFFLEADAGSLSQYSSVVDENLSEDDEFTNSAVYDEKTVLVTHTILERGSDKAITDCKGELLLVRHDAAQNITTTTYAQVGAMPDAVAITPNKKYALTADEHDSKESWGKCPIGSIKPSVSILQLTDDAGALLDVPKVVKKLEFGRGKLGPREPEYIAVASDSDTVAVTLQDSHEVAIFKISEVLAK